MNASSVDAQRGAKRERERVWGVWGDGSAEKRTINHCLSGVWVSGFLFHSSHLTCIRCQLNLLHTHTQKPTSKGSTRALLNLSNALQKIEFHLNRTKRNKRHTIAHRRRGWWRKRKHNRHLFIIWFCDISFGECVWLGRWRSVWHAFNENDDIFIYLFLFKYLSCQSIKSIQAHACTAQQADRQTHRKK